MIFYQNLNNFDPIKAKLHIKSYFVWVVDFIKIIKLSLRNIQ